MFLVGLTGGIASGKSTVVNMMRERGITVLDADVYARLVVEPGEKAHSAILKEFGSEVFHANGTLNRQKLAQIVFDNKAKRRRLNEITHPEIFKRIVKNVVIEFFKGRKFVVLDLPLLFESGMMISWMHKIIVVTCDPEQQMSRLTTRDSMDLTMAQQRIRAQYPMETKASRANFVIDNSGNLTETEAQVVRMVNLLKADPFANRLRLVAAASALLLIGSVYLFFTY